LTFFLHLYTCFGLLHLLSRSTRILSPYINGVNRKKNNTWLHDVDHDTIEKIELISSPSHCTATCMGLVILLLSFGLHPLA